MISSGQSSDIKTILVGCDVSFSIFDETLKNFGDQLSSGLAIPSSQVSQGPDSTPDFSSLSQSRHSSMTHRHGSLWEAQSAFQGIENLYIQDFWITPFRIVRVTRSMDKPGNKLRALNTDCFFSLWSQKNLQAGASCRMWDLA